MASKLRPCVMKGPWAMFLCWRGSGLATSFGVYVSCPCWDLPFNCDGSGVAAQHHFCLNIAKIRLTFCRAKISNCCASTSICSYQPICCPGWQHANKAYGTKQTRDYLVIFAVISSGCLSASSGLQWAYLTRLLAIWSFPPASRCRTVFCVCW